MEKVKKILTNTLFVNLVCGLITMGYFILFSKQYSKLGAYELEDYLHLSSLVFLIISIVFMEISYRNGKGLIFINGIEFLIIAIFVLLTQHMIYVSGSNIEIYSLTGANIIGVYYILKSAILYTKIQQDKLNSLSDIKEIVKDEQKKIIPRRKNKKEEGK